MKINVFASGSSGNSYLISDGETSLLLDVGITVKQLMKELNFDLSVIDGCLITHSHQDHSKGAKELAKMGVDIYTSGGTLEACKLSGHRFHRIKALEIFRVGTFRILPFDVQHDAPEPLGFLIESTHLNEKLLYFTDTYYIKYRFDKLNYIMAECNYGDDILKQRVKDGDIHPFLYKRLLTSHMSLEHFIKMLQANDLSEIKEIYLLHLSNANSDEQMFKREVQRATGAEVYVC